MARKIEETYRCITKLKEVEDYYDRWRRIKESYSPKINTDLFFDEVQYTPHDYDAHCRDIYNILDLIVPESAYLNTINVESLFLLDVAVVLHDVFMVLDPKSRNTHSKNAREYLKNEVLSRSSGQNVLKENLTATEVKLVADIVYGHCDLKDEEGNVVSKTIEVLPERNFIRGKMGPVNTRLLGALLRISDELDINSERTRMKSHLYGRISDASQAHWRKCEIFLLPTLDDSDVTKICLTIDSDKIRMDGNFENDLDLADQVRMKVQRELDYLNTVVFRKPRYFPEWQLQKVVFNTDDSEIIERLEKVNININPLEVGIIDIDLSKSQLDSDKPGDPVTVQQGSSRVKVIDQKLSDDLQYWVFSNRLLRDGHFHVDSGTATRDWIDTTSILSNRYYQNRLTTAFVRYLRQNIASVEDCYIVGEGFPGLILASLVAVALGRPFSYVIPSRDGEAHIAEEKEILSAGKPGTLPILITDVVVSGRTINTSLKSLCKTFETNYRNVPIVLSVFWRPALNSTKRTDDEIFSKLVCVNASIPIEICTKESCLFQEKRLIRHQYEPVS